jgi:hypothetical protein
MIKMMMRMRVRTSQWKNRRSLLHLNLLLKHVKMKKNNQRPVRENLTSPQSNH